MRLNRFTLIQYLVSRVVLCSKVDDEEGDECGWNRENREEDGKTNSIIKKSFFFSVIENTITHFSNTTR